MATASACSEVAGLLQPLVEGSLTAAERTAVEQHLADCPSCTAEGARLRDNSAYLEEVLAPFRMPREFGTDFLFRLPKKDPKRRAAAPSSPSAPRTIVMGDTRARRGSPLVVGGLVLFLGAGGALAWLFLRTPEAAPRREAKPVPEAGVRQPKGEGPADPRKPGPEKPPTPTVPSPPPVVPGGVVRNAADLLALVRAVKGETLGPAVQRGWDLLAGTPAEGKAIREEAAKEKSPRVRAALVLCLGASADPDLRAAVASFLADDAPEVRSAAALGLARSLSFEAPGKRQVPAGPPLNLAVQVGALAEDPARSDLLGRLARESDPAVRRTLLLVLAPTASGDAAIRDAVLEGVKGAYGDELREVCVRSLQGVQDAALVPVLAEAVTQPGTPKTLVPVILETMIGADRNAAAEALAGLVPQAEAVDLRKELVQALGRAGGEPAKRGLLRVLSEDGEGTIRLAAAFALRNFPEREVLEALQRAAENDGDHVVRQQAESAAKEMAAKVEKPAEGQAPEGGGN